MAPVGSGGQPAFFFAFNTCTLPHESNCLITFCLLCCKRICLSQRPPELLGAQCWLDISKSFLKQQQHQQRSHWLLSSFRLLGKENLCPHLLSWSRLAAAQNFQKQEWKPNQLELIQTPQLFQGWIWLQVTIKYAWTIHEIWTVSNRDWSTAPSDFLLTWRWQQINKQTNK